MSDLALQGWLLAMIGLFVIPVIVFVIIRHINPDMRYKRSLGFWIGWIPSNLISCWYLHNDVGIISSIMLFLFMLIIQAVFICFLSSCLID
jgi:hypothetical protein